MVSARRYRLQQSARQSTRTTPLDAATTSSVQNLSFNTAGIFGLGVGYQFNNWFRADVTGEYRGNSQFSRHRPHHLSRRRRRRHLSRHQVRVGRPRQRLCRSRHLVVHDAVHRRRRRRRAGLDHELHRHGHRQPWRRRAAGPRLRRQRVEVEFRLGAARRSRLQGHAELHRRTRLSLPRHGRRPDRRSPTFDGINDIVNPTTFKNITSHDLKLGVRWDLDSPPVYAPPPLVRKG